MNISVYFLLNLEANKPEYMRLKFFTSLLLNKTRLYQSIFIKFIKFGSK
jgi:hypothetical protein